MVPVKFGTFHNWVYFSFLWHTWCKPVTHNYCISTLHVFWNTIVIVCCPHPQNCPVFSSITAHEGEYADQLFHVRNLFLMITKYTHVIYVRTYVCFKWSFQGSLLVVRDSWSLVINFNWCVFMPILLSLVVSRSCSQCGFCYCTAEWTGCSQRQCSQVRTYLQAQTTYHLYLFERMYSCDTLTP